MKSVPMRVPVVFQKYVREKAGKKNQSMFKYLTDLANEDDEGKSENKPFFKW